MRLESPLQTKIINNLKDLGFYAYKHPPSPTGFPDVHAFKDGKHYWFEVKRNEAAAKAKYKNKKLQKRRRKDLRKAGDIAEMVWNWEQVERIINDS